MLLSVRYTDHGTLGDGSSSGRIAGSLIHVRKSLILEDAMSGRIVRCLRNSFDLQLRVSATPRSTAPRLGQTKSQECIWYHNSVGSIRYYLNF